MPKQPKVPTPTPEEDLGRGGDAASGIPAGSRGKREEFARDLAEPPTTAGPRPVDPAPPPSATK